MECNFVLMSLQIVYFVFLGPKNAETTEPRNLKSATLNTAKTNWINLPLFCLYHPIPTAVGGMSGSSLSGMSD